jgi:hypothetical protein
VALSALLLWRFVGEVLLPIVTRHPGLGHWLPSGAGDAVVGLGGQGRLSAAAGLALVLAYTGGVCAAAAASFLRRDAL